MIKLTESQTRFYDTQTLHADRADAQVIGTFFRDCAVYSDGSYGSDFIGPRDVKRHFDNLVMFAVGLTVETYSREQRIMSDVWDYVTYAVVLNPTTKEFETINLGCGGDHCVLEVRPDACAGTMALYAAQKEVARIEAEACARKADEDRRAADKAREEKRVAKGRTVKVVRGRKVPVGTTGVVFWLKDCSYGPRAGFKTKDGTVVWIDARNLEAVAA